MSQHLQDQDSQMKLLKSLSGGSGSEGDGKGVIDALEIMIENLRKECYAHFAERGD